MLRHKTLLLSLDRNFWPKLEHQARKKKKLLLYNPKIVFIFQIVMCLNLCLLGITPKGIFLMMIKTLVLLCKICTVQFSYDPWNINFQGLRRLFYTTINVWKSRSCHLCCSMVNCFRGVVTCLALKHFDSLSKPYTKMLRLHVIMCEARSILICLDDMLKCLKHKSQMLKP